jgi:hypothetical protein
VSTNSSGSMSTSTGSFTVAAPTINSKVLPDIDGHVMKEGEMAKESNEFDWDSDCDGNGFEKKDPCGNATIEAEFGKVCTDY